jgi:flavin-dependent dehydrogenase
MSGVFDTEVFVAGGGPAGLAAAIAARQRGFAVTLVDCAHPPIDKACGEGIMPDGLAALGKLGVELSSASAYSFHGIRFMNESHVVEANFPHGQGYGIRRTRLHEILVARAAELSVSMHWGGRITGITSQGVSVNSHEVKCKWLIGADGQNSRLRGWSGLESGSQASRRFGFRRHFRVAPWSKYVEIYWSDCGQMYVTPVGEDEICVALISRNPQLRFDEVLGFFPAVAERLCGALAGTREQGAVTPTRRLRSVYRGHTALIGEASGSVDAITGEGLSMSFQQAVELADAMKRGDFAGYQAAHRRIARLPWMMSKLMLTMDQHHSFRNRVFRAFDAEPSFFSKLLAIHTGAISPTSFGAARAVSLGWHLLTA